jgi:hypothetical protein
MNPDLVFPPREKAHLQQAPLADFFDQLVISMR